MSKGHTLEQGNLGSKRGCRHQKGTMSRQLEDYDIAPSVKPKERQENLRSAEFPSACKGKMLTSLFQTYLGAVTVPNQSR